MDLFETSKSMNVKIVQDVHREINVKKQKKEKIDV